MGSNHDQSSGGPAATRIPAGLGKAGRGLWRDLTRRYEFDHEGELTILAAACRQLDSVAALEAAITADGLTVTGSTGQVRVHPAVAEARQGRLALSRLLSDLRIPSEDAGETEKRTTAAARRAAAARWARPRQQRTAG
jgi:hypothetical protein